MICKTCKSKLDMIVSQFGICRLCESGETPEERDDFEEELTPTIDLPPPLVSPPPQRFAVHTVVDPHDPDLVVFELAQLCQDDDLIIDE